MTTQHLREEGSWERVTAALERVVGEGRPAGSWMRYCCPVHEAGPGRHNPSLIAKHLGDAGRTKVQCRAGCDDRQVLDALGLTVRDLYDAPLTRARDGQRPVPRARPRRVTRADRAINAAGLPLAQPKRDRGQQLSPWRRVTAYPYVRDDGTVAGEVVRQEACFENGRDKRFFQHRWDTERGEMVDGGFEAIPYQLPQLLAAIREGQPVAICEGEKDADALTRAGLIATTNTGGALSWTDAHARWLHGAREVVVVVDRDPAGYRRADKVLDSLAGHVGAVRVVQAATGKDASDHLAAGHGLDELDPVPYLDPATPTPTAARTPGAAVPFAGEASPGEAAGVSATHPPTPEHESDGGTPMGEWTGLDQSPQAHDDTVDHLSSHFARFMQLLMAQIMQYAQAAALRRQKDAEYMAQQELEKQREYTARTAAECKAVEQRLAKLAKAGWGNASRSEIASALRDAASWADDSEEAKRAMTALTGHIRSRFGIHIDETTGHTSIESPTLLGHLAKVEQDEATAARLRSAQDQMTRMVAADAELDESKKQALYREIEDWRRNPSGQSLQTLSKKMETAGVGTGTRTRVRFVAVYLGGQALDTEIPIHELGATVAAVASNELRKTPEPLVDPGDVDKPRADKLLTKYQDWLRTGRDTTEVTREIARTIAVMSEEDQDLARQRGIEIRNDPSGEYQPLWGDYVDRDELGGTVRLYAAMARQVEEAAVAADSLDADAVRNLGAAAAKHRRAIEHALTHGKGLHAVERAQLESVLRDIDAGSTKVPQLLWADDRSAAAADAERSDQIASDTALFARREVEEILSTSAAPPGAARDAHHELNGIVIAQTQIASGRLSLGDYEDKNLDGKLGTRLAAAGVPENVRNRVGKSIDRAAGEAVSAGKRARTVQNRWAERREAVAAGRVPSKPVPYDSPERRAAFEQQLRAAGHSEDAIKARLTADLGHARPASDAVKQTPGDGGKARRTTPGQGIHRATHRGRGDQRGYGK